MKITAEQIKAARIKSGLSAARAASLVFKNGRSWFAWERGERDVDPAVFELFLLKTGQHEDLRLIEKSNH